MGLETFREWLIRLAGLIVGLTIGNPVLSIRACSNNNILLQYRTDLKIGNLLV